MQGEIWNLHSFPEEFSEGHRVQKISLAQSKEMVQWKCCFIELSLQLQPRKRLQYKGEFFSSCTLIFTGKSAGRIMQKCVLKWWIWRKSKSIVLIEKEETECFRMKEEHGLGFCKLVIHTTQESTGLSRRFRILSKPQQYVNSIDLYRLICTSGYWKTFFSRRNTC